MLFKYLQEVGKDDGILNIHTYNLFKYYLSTCYLIHFCKVT